MSKQRQLAPTEPSSGGKVQSLRRANRDFAGHARPEQPSHTERRVPIALTTSGFGGNRLVAAVASGRDEFVLTDLGGALSIRVRLSIDASAIAREMVTSLDGTVVDWNTGRVEHAGQQTMLSKTELRLLACLLDAHADIVSHDRLIRSAWPDSPPKDPDSALAVYVCYLRRRLKPIGLGGALKTVRGKGYVLSMSLGKTGARIAR
jgi:DNA-binding response OmpR family regulator